MKHKTLFATTALFFILINTTHFWDGRLGILAMPAAVALFLYYIFLLVVLVQQVYLLVKERGRDWQRFAATGFLFLVVLFAYLKPRGVINFNRRVPVAVLVAQMQASGDCHTQLQLFSNKSFTETNECFGTTEVKGKYEVAGDTIYFKEVDMGNFDNTYFEYAIIKKGDASKPGKDQLIKYHSGFDKEGQSLMIIKNSLR